MTEPLEPEPITATSETPDPHAGLVEARDRYRSERDAARDLAARFQRAEIERIASADLSHPDDLFTLSGNGIDDYLTDDGSVDHEKVAADVAAIVAERPGLQKPTPPPPAVDRSQGMGATTEAQPSWADLLRN